jgi:hypothetical protein
VAHSTEQRYLVRVADRIRQALDQLPSGEDCWVAVTWSNGAPAGVVEQVLQTIELPRRVVGVLLVGSAVSFPDPESHHYCTPVYRDGEPSHERSVISDEEHPLAGPILEHFERSSGVRAILVRDPSNKTLRCSVAAGTDASSPSISCSNLTLSGGPRRYGPWLRSRRSDRPRPIPAADLKRSARPPDSTPAGARRSASRHPSAGRVRRVARSHRRLRTRRRNSRHILAFAECS